MFGWLVGSGSPNPAMGGGTQTHWWLVVGESLVGWLIGWLVRWLVGWLVRESHNPHGTEDLVPLLVASGWRVVSCSVGFLDGWMVGWLVGWVVRSGVLNRPTGARKTQAPTCNG